MTARQQTNHARGCFNSTVPWGCPFQNQRHSALHAHRTSSMTRGSRQHDTLTSTWPHSSTYKLLPNTCTRGMQTSLCTCTLHVLHDKIVSRSELHYVKFTDLLGQGATIRQLNPAWTCGRQAQQG
eukprot:5106615-Amphidinium_carterae.1